MGAYDNVVLGNRGQMVLGGGPYDIIGAYEILGDPRQPPAARQAAAAMIDQVKAARAAGGVYVREKEPQVEYEQILPCTSLAIAAGATREITLQPQRPFRIKNFRCSSTHTAPFFEVTAFTIGQDNQFIAPGSVPLDVFSEVALYSVVRGQTANPGSLVTLTVVNIDVDERDFRAAFFGNALIVT